MEKMVWVAVVIAALANPAPAAAQAPREQWHCQHEDARDCSAAHGSIDAGYLIARKELGFQVFGGPALPQEPLRILLDEYKKAGLAVWWIGDWIDAGRSAYYDGFNRRMEKAIDARRGRGYVRKLNARIAARTKAAEAR